MNVCHPSDYEYDRLTETGQLPDEADGFIDFGLAFQPHPREREYELARTLLTNSPDAADTARGATTHGGHHE
jgi:hypothetical protein